MDVERLAPAARWAAPKQSSHAVTTTTFSWSPRCAGLAVDRNEICLNCVPPSPAATTQRSRIATMLAPNGLRFELKRSSSRVGASPVQGNSLAKR